MSSRLDPCPGISFALALGLILTAGVTPASARPPGHLTLGEASDRVIETGTGETQEIILADGGSVLIGPQSRLIIRRFRWSAAQDSGELDIVLDRGATRIIGGALNRHHPIAISAGAAVLQLANGAAFVSNDATGIRAVLQFGGTLAVNAAGRAVIVERPGFAVSVTGTQISEPRRQQLAEARTDSGRLNSAFTMTVADHMAQDAQTKPRYDRPDEGAGTRGESLALVPQLTPIAFDTRPAALSGSGDLQLGLASLGAASANGSANTADSPDDILLVQDRVQGIVQDDPYAAFRDRNSTTSRLLPTASLDYAAATGGAAPTFGPQDSSLVYLFSSGLREILGIDGIEQLAADNNLFVRVTPEQINGSGAFPTSIQIFGETYTANATGTQYTAGGKTILRDTSEITPFYKLVPTVPTRDRYFSGLFVVTTSGAVRLGSNGQFVSDQIVLPRSIFGAADTVTTGTAGPSAARAFQSFDQAKFDSFAATGFASYEEAMQSLIAFVDGNIFVDPVEIASGTGFTAAQQVRVATVQSGFFLPEDPLERGGRAVDNFLFAQIQDADGRSIVYATGDVGTLPAGTSLPASIDSFVVARGLFDGSDLTGSDSLAVPFRAFLPDASTAGLPLSQIAQTSLLVANPAISAGATSQSRLFHADLGLSQDGLISTVSATFGTIEYTPEGLPDRRPDPDANINDDPTIGIVPADHIDDPRTQVTLTGRTLGSTRGSSGGATLFSSPLQATAIGGGRLWHSDTGDTLRPGRAGYLVIENSSTAANGTTTIGGLSSTLGTSVDDGFGYLRLAAGVRSIADTDRIGTAPSDSFVGRVAGVIEREDSAGAISAAPYLSTIALSLDAAANTVGAQIGDAADPLALTLGTRGTVAGDSAYIDASRYGAATTEGAPAAAIIAGDAVKGGLGEAGAAIRTYQHLQWGFFFGDVAIPGTARAHTALSSWVAGKPYTGPSCATGAASADCGIRGSAQYAGHAIGAVLNGNSGIRQVVGSFTQSWNLDARTGSMALSFDQANYGVARLAVTGQSRLTYEGQSDRVAAGGEDRQARIAGELVDVQQSVPHGSIGTFEIRSASGAYQANGTFGGDRAN
ncbi:MULTISPECIES: FecR domain-containing protein [unclassified Novosphingobium]|uniref:FecR domain-containing protein n=1 Tax=unclassified Novosphingobium TaxID=2644732 RepID=UPI001357FB4B|nr:MULTISPECIES: FecR domain-containing protein [unclassified Novosphingobium]